MRANEFLMEVPLPSDWDPAVYSQPTSFKKRLEYALERAARLGTGSSRVAFVIPFEGRDTVLKVAKNAKGIAQNKEEYNILSDGYVQSMGITIPFIDAGQDTAHNTTWVQTEKAEKLTMGKLRQFFGVADPFRLLITYAFSITSTGPNWLRRNPQELIQAAQQEGVSDDQLENIEDYGYSLGVLSSDYNVELLDFAQKANWGVFQGKPVVIDVGFTTEVKSLYFPR